MRCGQGTPPQQALAAIVGLHDADLHSILDELARLHLVVLRTGLTSFHTPFLLIQLTRTGRALIRHVFTLPAPHMPPCTLQSWHLRELARAYAVHYQARAEGRGPDYGGIGCSVWKRLRTYTVQGVFCPLIEARGMTITPFGCAFYERSYHR